MSTTAADNPTTNTNNNTNSINGNGNGIQYKIHAAYLNPLLAKHKSNQSLIYEDLIRSYEAAKRVILLLGKHNGTTTATSDQNEYAEKLLNELHNSQLKAYDKAARTALAQHVSFFDLPPIQSGETERVYVKKCVDASLCDVNCRGWRMVMDDNDDTAALVEALVGKKIRDRAAKLYREQRAEKFAIGGGAAVAGAGAAGVGHRREASTESTSVARGNNSKTLSTIAEEGNGDEVAQPEGDEKVDVAAVTADAPIEDDGEDGGDEDDDEEEVEGENAEDEEDMSEGEINEDDEENDNPEDDDAEEAEEENDGDGDEEEDADDGSDQVPEAHGKTGGAVITRQGRRGGAAALKPTTKRVAAQAGVSPPGQQPKRTRVRPTGMGGAARTGRQSPGAGRAGRGGRRSAKRSRRGGRGGGGKL